jgi:glyoxylase-like metal-dependent hydrolase (beta-lactamase superfamily II)
MKLMPLPRFVPLALAILLSACSLTDHPAGPSTLGQPSSLAALQSALRAGPGPLAVRTVRSARWQVPLEGLLNLDHPAAIAAGLQDRPEPIGIYLHLITHPKHGTFMVDSGVSERFRDGPSEALSWIVAAALDLSTLEIEASTAQILKALDGPVAGVLLTHLHLDHVMGISDLAPGTALFAGPGETRARGFEQLFTRGTFNRLLQNGSAISEWPFDAATGSSAASNAIAVVDVFGDASLFALATPGHTPGHTAYLARAADGMHLYLGDATHTAWGWEHGVEPGTFSADVARSAGSLAALKQLAQEHPALKVYPGHQQLPTSARAADAPAAGVAHSDEP